MSDPLLLDLFCGAGGAAMGYHRAGFEVVGVDIAPQPRYPFRFVQDDWEESLALFAPVVDAIHASPPCQAYSVSRHSHSKTHPDLLPAVRERLQATGKPWVIENVEGAPMGWSVTLCGWTFGLTATDDDGQDLALKRHRLFEASHLMMAPPCGCRERMAAGVMVGGVYGGGPCNRRKEDWPGFARRRGGYTPSTAVRAQLLGIDWMTQAELSQAIPPAYTEWVGEQLLGLVPIGDGHHDESVTCDKDQAQTVSVVADTAG